MENQTTQPAQNHDPQPGGRRKELLEKLDQLDTHWHRHNPATPARNQSFLPARMLEPDQTRHQREPRKPEVQIWGPYTSFEDWVENFWCVTFARPINNSTRAWCPQWWNHPETVFALHALWMSWEQYKQKDQPAIIQWLILYAYPTLQYITAPDGPMRGCNPDTGHKTLRTHNQLTTEPAPTHTPPPNYTQTTPPPKTGQQKQATTPQQQDTDETETQTTSDENSPQPDTKLKEEPEQQEPMTQQQPMTQDTKQQEPEQKEPEQQEPVTHQDTEQQEPEQQDTEQQDTELKEEPEQQDTVVLEESVATEPRYRQPSQLEPSSEQAEAVSSDTADTGVVRVMSEQEASLQDPQVEQGAEAVEGIEGEIILVGMLQGKTFGNLN